MSLSSVFGGSNKVTVRGGEELLRIRRNLEDANVNKSLEDSVKETAFVAEGAIKKGITQMHAVDTGYMRASTRTQTFKPGVSPAATVGPSADYAIFVHEGTRYVPERRFIPYGVKLDAAKFKKVMDGTGLKLAYSIGKR